MKKVLCSIIALVLFICAPSIVKAENKVNIYMFRSLTCPHCEAALEYINEHKDEIPKNINFVIYETSKNKSNSSLHGEISSKLGIPEKDQYSVPLFVVGDKYELGYLNADDFNQVINLAKSALDNDEYKDVVQEILTETKINAKGLRIDQIFSEPNKVVTIVVYSIFGLIVLGFAAMMIFSRK